MSRQEELELLCALVEGALEPSPWARFLDLLQRATSADDVIMNLRMLGRPFEEVVTLVSGETATWVQEAYGGARRAGRGAHSARSRLEPALVTAPPGLRAARSRA